jgi:VCBS repeat-containing protein
VNLSAAAIQVGDATIAAGTARDSFGDTDTLSGVEHVRGSVGADRIVGSAVANHLEGGAGDDILTGGGGVDSFVFLEGFGDDTVTDFVGATEVLRIDQTVFASRAEALAAVSVVGGSAVLSAASGDSITLSGVTQVDAWNIDILGQNDAPTLRATTAAPLTEAGHLVAGAPTSEVQLTPHDVDGVVMFDPTALAAAGWTASSPTTWTRPGVYGSVVLDTTTAVMRYTLDNADGDTQALATNQQVSETFTAAVIDNNGAVASRLVSFTINGTNDAPVAVSDMATAREAGTAAG